MCSLCVFLRCAGSQLNDIKGKLKPGTETVVGSIAHVKETPEEATDVNEKWAYWVVQWGLGKTFVQPEGDIVFMGGSKVATKVDVFKAVERVSLAMFGGGGLAKAFVPKTGGAAFEALSVEARHFVQNEELVTGEVLWLARYIWELCCFLDRQYGEGDGKWADRLFTGDGDMWALRTFSNKGAIITYGFLTVFELFMFGHYAPWFCAMWIGGLVIFLKLMQFAGILHG